MPSEPPNPAAPPAPRVLEPPALPGTIDPWQFYYHTNDLMVIGNLGGRFLATNPAWERTLGWTEAELTSRPWSDFVHPDDLASSQAAAGRLEGEDLLFFENRFRTRDGGWRHLAWHATRPIDGHTYGVARDITFQHHAYEAQRSLRHATESSSRKSQFVAMTSHEMITPLNALLGFLRRVLDHPSAQLDHRDRANLLSALRNGLALEQLTRDLLDLSKVEAGRLELHLSEVDLPTLIEEVLADVGDAANTNAVTLTSTCPPLPLHTDRARVRQILLNLLRNAVAFSAGGTVRLDATIEPHGGVTIAITDDGVGVDPARLSQIFEPYFRWDSAKTPSRPGAGLGLTISRHFARALGGDLVANSVSGSGSTFSLTLPPQPPAGATMPLPRLDG